MAKLIKQHSISNHADSIADYLPSGMLFEGARTTGTNIRKLLTGLGGELFTAEGYLKTITDEYDINTTTLFINEWEGALGIPDDCFSGAGTLTERRRDVLVKLAALGVQTSGDFEDLALKFGITATVRAGIDLMTFPLIFPWFFFATEKDARFTIVVDFTGVSVNTFPLTFPILFGNSALGVVECLFNKLKPANCNVIFRQV